MRRDLRWAATAAGLGAVALAGLGWALPRIAARRLRGRPDDPDPVLEPIVDDARSIPSHDGGTIHVVRAGEGPPIVLSHGVTLSVRTWVKQLARLPAHGFSTVAFDHRGHGSSELAPDAEHSIENLAADVRSVLEGLDLEDAVLVGHSMGGIAVQAFVALHPEVAAARVRGIVLLSTLARAPLGSRATRLRNVVERVSSRTPDTTRLWASPHLGLVFARLGFGVDPKPSHVELVRQMMLECAPDTRRDAPRALVGLDLTAALAEIAIPTLVVCGTDDRLTPPPFSQSIARRVPEARLELIDGGGHMLMLERPDELERLLVDFARTAGARAPVGGP